MEIHTNSPEVDEAIDKLVVYLKNGRSAVLAGAGISFRSGIPLVAELVPTLLSELGAVDGECKDIRELPFESIFEVLQRNTYSDRLFDIFVGTRPNLTHHLLAALLSSKLVRLVATTNFDRLLEEALLEQNFFGNDGCTAVTRDEELGKLGDPLPGARLVKLHGCIGDRGSMCATLTSVARRESSVGRSRAVRHLFGDGRYDCILIVGYSCSDAFDISPEIERIATPRTNIFLVQHSSGASVAPVGAQSTNNPFRKFPGCRVLYDTERLIGRLREQLFPEMHFEPVDEKPMWRTYVAEWAERNSRDNAGFRGYCTALLLNNVGSFERAALRAETAANQFHSAGDSRGASYAMRLRGHAFHGLGEFDAAIAAFEQSLQSATDACDAAGVSADLSNLSNSWSQKGDFAKAEEYSARLSARTPENPSALPFARLLQLSHLHRVAGRYEEAESAAREAAALSATIGNKIGEAAALGNLATAQRHLGKVDAALETIRRSFGIYEAVGDRKGQGTALSNLGAVLFQRGDVAEARDCCEKALDISRETHDRNAEGFRLGMLGKIVAETGMIPEAIRLQEQALAIVKEVGAKRYEMLILWDLSISHGKINDDATALRYRNDAAAVYGHDAEPFRTLVAEANNSPPGDRPFSDSVP